MAIPVGWTDREEAFLGWRERGRVKLVTTNFSPQALRYWFESLRMKVRVSGRE
jgi:hypothetical protein